LFKVWPKKVIQQGFNVEFCEDYNFLRINRKYFYDKKTIIKLLATGVLHLIQINHQPDATIFQFIILTFIYSSTCFGRFPAHYQELNDCSSSLRFYLRIVALPRTQHDCHHNTKVKLKAVNAVIGLLMMGGEMPETC
jgi:hypothetical protein